MNLLLANQQHFEKIKLIKPSIDLETFNQRIKKQKRNELQFLMLIDADNPVCFVVISLKGKSTHPEYPDFFDLYTREEFRGKGYASIIIKNAEKIVHALGFKYIGLAVNPFLNAKAKELYLRLGFKETGEKEYLDGVYDGKEDWVIDMVKKT